MLNGPINTRKTILFLGAGFNFESKNADLESFPSGEALKQQFMKHLGLSETVHDLKLIAEHASRKCDIDLPSFLSRKFTVGKVSNAAKSILACDWLRIYTTNYDNLVEFAFESRKAAYNSYSYLDPYPAKIPQNTVIHLHGSHDDLLSVDPLDQIVLDEKSYIRYDFSEHPWYDQLLKDIKYATNIIFCGYSLRDLHIRRIIQDSRADREKTFFFIGPDADEVSIEMLSEYGLVDTTGISGLSQIIAKNGTIEASDSMPPESVKTFRYLNPFRDKRSAVKPTAEETKRLLTKGIINTQRIFDTYPQPIYVVPRVKQVDQAAEAIHSGRNLLISAWTGNGKSVFIDCLASSLSEKGFHIFKVVEFNEVSLEEIDSLKSIGKVCFIYENYDLAIRTARIISSEIPSASIVIAVRASLAQLRYHEVQEASSRSLHTVNLNQMTDDEQNDFKELISVAGADKLFSKSRHPSFREALLDLFQNEYVTKQLDQVFEKPLGDRYARAVLITVELMRWYGVEAHLSVVQRVTRCDPVSTLMSKFDNWYELFDVEAGKIFAKSSVLSEFIIKKYTTPSEIIEICRKIVDASLPHMDSREYYALFSTFLNFSKLHQIYNYFFGKETGDLILEFYDDLRFDVRVHNEPLFWLQYSFAQLEYGDVELSEQFIGKSYSVAHMREGYRTYQIDTHALRVYLASEIENPNKSEERLGKIDATFAKVAEMIENESHRDYVLRALDQFELFAKTAGVYMGNELKNSFIVNGYKMIRALQLLSPERRAQTGADSVRMSLERAMALLSS